MKGKKIEIQIYRRSMQRKGYSRIRISTEHKHSYFSENSGYYDLGGIVISGNLILEIDGNEHIFSNGDWFYIPAETVYKVIVKESSCEYLIGKKTAFHAHSEKGRDYLVAAVDFLRKKNICVIASHGDDFPESSVVNYVLGKDASIYIGTRKDFRKYDYMIHDPHVSLVFTDGEEISVQCEGLAQEVSYSEINPEMSKQLAAYIKANYFFGLEDEIAYFKIHPQWLRYTDVLGRPWEIFEITWGEHE